MDRIIRNMFKDIDKEKSMVKLRKCLKISLLNNMKLKINMELEKLE